MKKSRISRFYLYIAIATFITIMTVIIQKSYNNLMGPIKTAQTSSLTKSLSPQLPVHIIEQIENKKEFFASDISTSAASLIQQATPTTTLPTTTP